ncbi:OPT oligopeptide transporter protein-domain-containing protein, partial [Hysterangium stoloniferum]
IFVAFVYIIPIGMIQAITNQQIGLNVITELIIGYALPGKPVAMMMFKTWGYISMTQTLKITSDFKLGHYMKVPPPSMFWCQASSPYIILSTLAYNLLGASYNCCQNCPTCFLCPNVQVFGVASIIWGVIDPLLNWGELYTRIHPLTFFFLAGTILPIIPYLITRNYPGSVFKYLNFPVIFNGTGHIPPATTVNYILWAIV